MPVSAYVNEALYLPAQSFVPWIFALLMRATYKMCGPPRHGVRPSLTLYIILHRKKQEKKPQNNLV